MTRTPTEIADLAAWAEKASSAIYLATEASVADDISAHLKKIADLLRTLTPSPDHRAAAEEFDALAEKATQGPMRSMREGNQYLDGLHSADGKSLVGASRVDGLARPWNRGGAALFIDMEHVSRFRDADADFIAWCFNHRTEISRVLGGAVGDRYAEGYAAAREDAAKIVDGEIYQEYYRRWPQFGTGNVRNDSYNARLCDALATAIRALKPQGGEE